MSFPKLSKSLLLKIGLSTGAIVITIIVIELAGRYLYSKDTATSTTLELIENVNKPSGNKLRMTAWNESFTQRGLDVPETGPRDGKSGDRITPNRCMVTECVHIKTVPGIIEIDDTGLQHAGKKEDASPDILIIGGSVAWGAASSDIENTYFNKLYNLLKTHYPEIGITVLAGAGSTSSRDLYAFVDKGLKIKPDVVIYLNGLNDITINEPLIKRAGDYLLNMRTAAKIAEQNGIEMVIVRQPFPGNKKVKTELEKRIIELSHEDFENTMNPLYKYIGVGLEKISEQESIYYIDTAGCFDDERATTFSDQWHFSDPGQELFAGCIYEGLLPVLEEVQGN